MRVQDGVYFVRGHFIDVDEQSIILEQYSNDGSHRVGLFIEEEIITAYDDESLLDNAQGFNNYAAPGADRLRIEATLGRKDIDDFRRCKLRRIDANQRRRGSRIPSRKPDV